MKDIALTVALHCIPIPTCFPSLNLYLMIKELPNVFLQELLFCETCDLVFCLQCVGGSHVTDAGEREAANIGSISNSRGVNSSNRNSVVSYMSYSSVSESGHTVIPLSVARKRMSEIVIYKANECSTKVRLLRLIH